VNIAHTPENLFTTQHFAPFIPALEVELENMIRDTLWIKLMEIKANGFQMN
jgi:hypothetical protein